MVLVARYRAGRCQFECALDLGKRSERVLLLVQRDPVIGPCQLRLAISHVRKVLILNHQLAILRRKAAFLREDPLFMRTLTVALHCDACG